MEASWSQAINNTNGKTWFCKKKNDFQTPNFKRLRLGSFSSALRVSSWPKKKKKEYLSPIDLGDLSLHAKFQFNRTSSLHLVAISILFVWYHSCHGFVLESCFYALTLLLKNVKNQIKGILSLINYKILNLYSNFHLKWTNVIWVIAIWK